MTKIFLLRHCETDWNRDKKYIGKTDIPLNENGRKTAESLAEQFRNQKISAVYSSALSRTIETAKAIAKQHSLEVIQLRGLNEINFGDWEGKTFEEIEQSFPKEAKKYLKNPSAFRFPKGENLVSLRARVLRAFDALLKKHSKETILIVGHASTNRIILCKALGASQKTHWRIKQDNGCINIAEFFGKTAIVSLLNSQILQETKK